MDLWSDTCYSNPEYDALYVEQQTLLDPDERQAVVHEMQQILYRDMPEIQLWYPNSFEAWRSDRWTGFLPWPEPDGLRFHPYSVMSIRPVTGAVAAGPDAGPSGIVWLVGLRLARRDAPAHPAPSPSSRRLLRVGDRVGGWRYVLRKVLEALATLVFVLVFNFFLFRIMPSDPVRILTRQRGVRLTPEARAEMASEIGLDKPLPAQFLDYVGDLLRGDFGSSFIYRGRSVMDVFLTFLWPTVLLVGTATVLMIVDRHVPGHPRRVGPGQQARSLVDGSVPHLLLHAGLLAGDDAADHLLDHAGMVPLGRVRDTEQRSDGHGPSRRHPEPLGAPGGDAHPRVRGRVLPRDEVVAARRDG